MSTTLQEGQKLVTDVTLKLSCGCLMIYLEGNLDRGQMFHCKHHLKADIFTQLNMADAVTRQVKMGATRIELGGV